MSCLVWSSSGESVIAVKAGVGAGMAGWYYWYKSLICIRLIEVVRRQDPSFE